MTHRATSSNVKSVGPTQGGTRLLLASAPFLLQPTGGRPFEPRPPSRRPPAAVARPKTGASTCPGSLQLKLTLSCSNFNTCVRPVHTFGCCAYRSRRLATPQRLRLSVCRRCFCRPPHAHRPRCNASTFCCSHACRLPGRAGLGELITEPGSYCISKAHQLAARAHAIRQAQSPKLGLI